MSARSSEYSLSGCSKLWSKNKFYVTDLIDAKQIMMKSHYWSLQINKAIFTSDVIFTFLQNVAIQV